MYKPSPLNRYFIPIDKYAPIGSDPRPLFGAVPPACYKDLSESRCDKILDRWQGSQKVPSQIPLSSLRRLDLQAAQEKGLDNSQVEEDITNRRCIRRSQVGGPAAAAYQPHLVKGTDYLKCLTRYDGGGGKYIDGLHVPDPRLYRPPSTPWRAKTPSSRCASTCEQDCRSIASRAKHNHSSDCLPTSPWAAPSIHDPWASPSKRRLSTEDTTDEGADVLDL